MLRAGIGWRLPMGWRIDNAIRKQLDAYVASFLEHILEASPAASLDVVWSDGK
jgi:hypothetical protein